MFNSPRMPRTKSGLIQNLRCSFCVTAVVFAVTTACHAGQQPPKTASPFSATGKASRQQKPLAVKAAAKSAALVYECPDCHDKFTNAQAKKADLKCACCQTKLVSIKPPTKPAKTMQPKVKKG